MHPNRENLAVINNDAINNYEKLRRLDTTSDDAPVFEELVEKAFKYAGPVVSEIGIKEGESPNRIITDFITPKREVTAGDGTKLWLDFFIFRPSAQGYASLQARWYNSPDSNSRKLIEVLSAKNFDEKTVSYREDNSKMLKLLAESLEVYEAAAAAEPAA